MLNRSVVEGEAKAYIEALMEELICCTVWHFRHEERLMLKYGYEGLEEHKSEHKELALGSVGGRQDTVAVQRTVSFRTHGGLCLSSAIYGHPRTGWIELLPLLVQPEPDFYLDQTVSWACNVSDTFNPLGGGSILRSARATRRLRAQHQRRVPTPGDTDVRR